MGSNVDHIAAVVTFHLPGRDGGCCGDASGRLGSTAPPRRSAFALPHIREEVERRYSAAPPLPRAWDAETAAEAFAAFTREVQDSPRPRKCAPLGNRGSRPKRGKRSSCTDARVRTSLPQ